MRLTEVYNRLKIDEFWKQVEVSYMSGEVNMPPKLQGLLNDADTLVFEKFGLKPSDKVYFIAGSARLHLDPKLKKTFTLKGDIGDLDMVIPDKSIWERALEKGTLPKDEVTLDGAKGYAYRPNDNKVIEVFSVWNPAFGGDEYADTTVRTSKEIVNDAVEKGGYYFMSIGDVIDYKLKMNREKEKDVVELIDRFRNAPDTEENMEHFFRKLVDIIGEKETETLRKTIN
tara:strand:+ start:814 stop:1497 length:684 start_codon:yes stop_codon:yes gene_type:complete